MSRRNTLSLALWLTFWWFAMTAGPVFIVDKLILGHAMPDWVAGAMGFAGGLLLLWIERRINKRRTR